MATKKVELRRKNDGTFEEEIVVRSDWDIIDNVPAVFPPEAHTHPVEDIDATGTLNSTTFLRGDGVWSAAGDIIALENAAGDGLIWDAVNNEFDVIKSTTQQAEEGLNDTSFMTPLKVAQAIAELVQGGGGAEVLNDLTDVVITSPDNTDFLGYNGTAWVNKQVPTTDLTTVNNHIADTTIHFTQANINIAASQTTSGTFEDARIPNLNASKITAGTLALAQGGTNRTDGRSTGVIETRASNSLQFWQGTQAQYDAIGTKDTNTIYLIQE